MRSSYKFCLIASGEYDVYAARPRAKEWDIAAGHAIAEHAGAIITTHQMKKITYGKPGFYNPSLLVRRAKKI
jgi:3'(2'), 5'-bisphosphate nucleotidase